MGENLGHALPHDLAHRGRFRRVIDQSRLPFEFATLDLNTLDDAAQAIRTMVVRGAPLIGATAAYGMALAMRVRLRRTHISTKPSRMLQATRPTAHNLAWALTRMRDSACGSRAGASAPTRRFEKPR